MAAEDIKSLIETALQALSREDHPAAISAAQESFSMRGENPEGLLIMSLLALQLGELSRAIELARGACELDPDCRDYAEVLAILHARAGNLKDSLFYGKLGSVLKPHPTIEGLVPRWIGTFQDNFMAVEESGYLRDGFAAYREGRLADALGHFEKEAELRPQEAPAWRMLSKIMAQLDRPVESHMLLQAIEDVPDDGEGDLFLQAGALARMGKFAQAIETVAKAGERDERNSRYLAERLAILYMMPSPPFAEIETAEARLADSLSKQVQAYRHDHFRIEPGDRIRVGILSGRFRPAEGLDHVWQMLLQAPKGGLEIYCYSSNDFDDVFTRRLAGAVHDFNDLRDVNDLTVARVIYNDGIDILIDMDGCLATGRPLVTAARPAPLMVRYQGWPAVMPARGFDAALGGEGVFSEADGNILLVRNGLFAMPGAEPGLQAASVPRGTLGKLGWCPAMHRVSVHSLGLLAGILKADDRLRISLYVQGCGGVIALDQLEAMFRSAGLADRIDYVEPAEDTMTGFDRFLSEADALLDLEGDCGPDHALRALSCGMPVLSLAGAWPAQRSVSGMLTGMGLADCAYRDVGALASAVGLLCSDEQELNRRRDQAVEIAAIEQSDGKRLARFRDFEAAVRGLVTKEGSGDV